ncbi:MAG: type VI secretion system tip protein TssI/VgrG [Acetobacteraceae bacterium]
MKDRTRFQMEAAEALASVYDGVTRFGGMIPGAKFNVASRPASPFDGSYVVRSTNHHASDDTWINQSGTQTSVVRFTAFPSAVTWREPMTTPRPRMDGVHTALVMGPQSAKGGDIKSQDGEEIHTDDLGRVKVRFYWDHRAEATGGDAIWARVIQPWAGNGWGAQFTPRVGTEVAVAFVDGDPDRPIVIGGLYNGRDKPIYTKADKTKLGFRSRSSLKGGSSEFNEFTFDDKKGNELVYVQAQKDHTTYVKHDQTLKIDNCRIVTVKQDETVDVQNNQTIK